MERVEVLDIPRRRAVDPLDIHADEAQPGQSSVAHLDVDVDVDALSLIERTMDLEDALQIELLAVELTDLATTGVPLRIVSRLKAKAVEG